MVNELPSQQYLKSIFNYDENSGLFRWRIKHSRNVCIGNIVGTTTNDGYIHIGLNKKAYTAHRLAWKYYYGIEPENHIDHINGNKSDNSILNLREATTIENGRNQKKASNNTSGFKGVSYNKKYSKWNAYAKINGINKNLGSFNTPEEASIAYIEYTVEHFKEFYKNIV